MKLYLGIIAISILLSCSSKKNKGFGFESADDVAINYSKIRQFEKKYNFSKWHMYAQNLGSGLILNPLFKEFDKPQIVTYSYSLDSLDFKLENVTETDSCSFFYFYPTYHGDTVSFNNIRDSKLALGILIGFRFNQGGEIEPLYSDVEYLDNPMDFITWKTNEIEFISTLATNKLKLNTWLINHGSDESTSEKSKK